jgi:REP-associated tyrosine transposase
MNPTPLINGHYYHIYNRGNNSDNIFYEKENYYYFLKLYDKYINPIANTFAWCLLKNHFHILVYIKNRDEINSKLLTFKTVKSPKTISASRQFSHFFNAYTQAINKRHHRTGSLFEKNFERKLVTSESYFQKLIFYIHNNPVHHGFTDKIVNYPWSSYGCIISKRPTKLLRHRVIEAFNDLENFKYCHSINQDSDCASIEHLIME